MFIVNNMRNEFIVIVIMLSLMIIAKLIEEFKLSRASQIYT